MLQGKHMTCERWGITCEQWKIKSNKRLFKHKMEYKLAFRIKDLIFWKEFFLKWTLSAWILGCLLIHSNRHFTKLTLKWYVKYLIVATVELQHHCALLSYGKHMCFYIWMLRVYTSHQHGIKLLPPHQQAQEDTSLHCSWMWVHDWICWWHNPPCTNT